MHTAIVLMIFLFLAGVLAFQQASISVWSIAAMVALLGFTGLTQASAWCYITAWAMAAIIFFPLWCGPIRRLFYSRSLYRQYQAAMPKMSATEKAALEAGGVGFEGSFFTGMPDWAALLKRPVIMLTQEEQAFIDGPVKVLCRMINNWAINHQSRAIPDEIWSMLKQEGFFGLIIPRSYGGKEFSALAHSMIIAEIASVSVAVGTTTCVPNSLGPAELLLSYGTDAQRNYYLPRLANGQDIPCFALTSPTAGSDASSIEDYGVVVRETINGEERVGIRLNWDKRYITLAPVATVIGLAFKLYDPDRILGGGTDLGITCALIPAETKGVVKGRYHFPLCSHFPNGPTQGKDVFIGLDAVIGGEQGVGQGWRMLMECLAAGRSISLPSMVTGSAKRAVYASCAYSRIRRQFNASIGQFGGIQEALVRACGLTYLIDALRIFSVSSIDHGVKSAVASAICKYHTTQYSRDILNDAMDIHGGKGICMGPSNYLAQSYIEGPISITVEGANILTRSMIIFGQGAIRCHPYMLPAMQAATQSDKKAGLHAFDAVFFKHLGLLVSNPVRAFVLALSRGRGIDAPKGPMRRFCQQLSRFSAAFAWVSDVAMFTLGGRLKRMERISARLGDLLSYLYMGAAVVHFYSTQSDQSSLPLARWVTDYVLFKLQTALDEVTQNFPNRFLRGLMRWVVLPNGCYLKPPSDALGEAVVTMLLSPGRPLDDLSAGAFFDPDDPQQPMTIIKTALDALIAIEPYLLMLSKADKKGDLEGMTFFQKCDSARDKNILTALQVDQIKAAMQSVRMVTDVDDFACPLDAGSYQ